MRRPVMLWSRRWARRFGLLPLIGLLAVVGCTTRGDAPGLPGVPTLPGFGGSASEALVYTGAADVVYRTVFEAVVAEFNTAPRIVKPEHGLLVFSEDNSDVTTSIVVKTVGENAASVHISSRGPRGPLRGRAASGVESRIVRALDERMARAEAIVPSPDMPRGTSALAEKQDALNRIQAALGFEVVPGYLIDMEAADLQHLANAIDKHVAVRETTQAERQESARVAIEYAKELHDQGRYEEGRAALERAVALDPTSAIAHTNLGEIYKHLRDFEQSLSHLERAKALDPNFPEIYINLGILYDDYVIDDAKAVAHYRKYLELGGTDPRVQDWIRAIEQES